jgi:hypothetical protein
MQSVTRKKGLEKFLWSSKISAKWPWDEHFFAFLQQPKRTPTKTPQCFDICE